MYVSVALTAFASATDVRGRGDVVDAASPNQINERQGDLKRLQGQIDAMRKELAASESSRKEAADQLQESERAISAAQREVRLLADQLAKLKTSIQRLESESRETEQRLDQQQRQLEKLLHRHYLRGRPDPLHVLLNGQDPNQAARDLHYLEAIGSARSQILLEIETTLSEKQALIRESRRQSDLLSATELRWREEQSRLLAQRQQRLALLKTFSDQINTQRQEIGSLRRDEKRLSDLVDRLARVLAARRAESRDAARREAQRRDGSGREAGPEPQNTGNSLGSERSSPTSAASVASEQPRPNGGLTQQRGPLHLPASGALAHRFGTSRQEGSTWKGVFIRAQPGSDVRSIARGHVVFAEWMRGFGNLLIVDHGESYLSIYANNEALLKQVGDEVRPGEAIATVGNSGGNPESGLYFEIRYQGKPLDPQAWLNLR